MPKNFQYSSIKDFDGKRIATTYPRVLGEFFAANNVNAEIHTISGSVEIAPSIGLADAICDLVSSGSTLFTNGLREVEIVMQSEAVLIARKNLSADLQAILDNCFSASNRVRAAKENKYILLNAPNEKLTEIIASAARNAEVLRCCRSPIPSGVRCIR